MPHQYSNLIKNPEEYYAKAVEHSKVWLLNREFEDLLAVMGCSDISEVTFAADSIGIVFPMDLMDEYTIETKILFYNLKKSPTELGYYILIEDENGTAVDDCISIYR